MAPVSNAAGATADLRAHLRSATMAAHDLLDAATRAAGGWRTLSEYARFLAMQHAARAPVEAWLAAHAPRELRPPAQTALIAEDLARLGAPVPAPAPLFTLGRAVAGHALGVAWVLAGSALGNRAIARQVARIGGGAWPTAFLGDEAMLAFWHGLRSRIERPCRASEAAGASEAAAAVFAHFLAETSRYEALESIGA
jgi:heme oxygenase (biliverdin-IX-beta and delta-forming)